MTPRILLLKLVIIIIYITLNPLMALTVRTVHADLAAQIRRNLIVSVDLSTSGEGTSARTARQKHV